MQRAPIIEALGLTKRFGPVVALAAIDLEVRRGESLALFGPNGAGKTTLLRILTTTLRATSGTLRIAGFDPRRHDREVRRRLGLIAHRTSLYDGLTARENLLFFARLYGVPSPADRAQELLEWLGLAERSDDPAGTLSRGMQQRLALARALVHDPEILLLDEPFTGLDAAGAAKLRVTLTALRRTGRTLLIVTHDLAEGLDLSDRWLILTRGRLAGSGASAGTDPAEFISSYAERMSGSPLRGEGTS